MILSGKSDIGLKRSTNQDCFNVTKLPDGCLVATVCDGMGGASGGNIASEIACRVYTDRIVSEFIPDKSDVRALMLSAVSDANKTVFERAKTSDELKGMGTTLVSVLLTSDGNAKIVNVGDSKLFAVTADSMKQITHDHSYVQYLVDMGQLTVLEAQKASIRNIIIRSVGNEENAKPDLFELQMTDEMTLLLCSDGLTSCAEHEQIVKIINECDDNLDEAADRLIELANSGGGNDNTTVVLIKR